MPHDQGHDRIDPRSGDRRVWIAVWANGLLTAAQVVGGVLAGSLALVADALHNLSDMASLAIALGARKIARRPPDARMTFGYGRIEVVAALINYTTLILMGAFLVYQGGVRIVDPPPVEGWTVVALGGVALAVDALTVGLTSSMQRDSVNIRALFLHNLSDALASVAVIVGGALILLHDARWVDPAITLAIAGYILWLSSREIGAPIRTLMLGAPPGIDGEEVVAALTRVDGVEGVHHVHLWQMQEREPALDCHVVVSDELWTQVESVKRELKARLREDFGIAHSSLEFEHAARAHVGAATYGHGDPAGAPEVGRGSRER